MDIQTADSGIHVNWRRLHALGLPAGSIRALLAILIFATTWGLLIFKPNQEVPDYVRDLLFIIMGHYFVVRRRSGPAEEPGPPPLYLPRVPFDSFSSSEASLWPSCFSTGDS